MRLSLSFIAACFSLTLCCPSSASAATAVQLSCATRGEVMIAWFKYQLTTMKWGDHFQIASGSSRHETASGKPYRVTTFRNGDDLVFFPRKEKYFLFYAGKDTADRCTVEESQTLPVVSLPHYEKPAPDAIS